MRVKVTAVTTDCESSLVKMGYILEERKVCTHIGCCNHRLESTTSIMFNAPGVKKALALARCLVARYSTSSQMTDRLAQLVRIYIDSEKETIQDMATRWWPTCRMVARLLELKQAIGRHKEEDALEPMLATVDWAVLDLISSILGPFMHSQTLLQDHHYLRIAWSCLYCSTSVRA